MMYAFFGGLAVFFVLGFINYNGFKAYRYIINFDTSEKVQKKDLILVLLKIWLFMFVLSFFSFAVLWYLAMFVWCIIMLLIFQFAILWKRNGYSLLLLIMTTAAVIIVSFTATSYIRILIFNLFKI